MLCRASTGHAHGEDNSLNQLLQSAGWQTLMTIAESSRELRNWQV